MESGIRKGRPAQSPQTTSVRYAARASVDLPSCMRAAPFWTCRLSLRLLQEIDRLQFFQVRTCHATRLPEISKYPACKLSGQMQEVFVEDFRRELGEIQSPGAKLLFILAKMNHLTHFRIAGYEAMIAMADRPGHYGVGVLLESCLADKLAFVERNRRV